MQADVKRASSAQEENGGIHLHRKDLPMRLGVSTAQCGPLADAAAVRSAARAAEQIGYSSLWVLDRLLAPFRPREGYAGTDQPLSEEMRATLDPFAVLAVSAAEMSRIRLGTSVLVAPWYPPVVLARMLTTLDVLSNGRLTAGLGVGWSSDEYAAVGLEMRGRGVRLEETLDVLDAFWSDGPVAHNLLRPVQRPRPPLFLAAYTPAGLDRVARRADGWMPAGLPVELLAPMWAHVRDAAAAHGRDPQDLELVVRANIVLTPTPTDGERRSYMGNVEQVASDIEATRAAGADEVILGVYGVRHLDDALDAYARIAEASGMGAPV